MSNAVASDSNSFSQNVSKLVLDNSAYSFIILNSDLKIVFFNKASEVIFGYSSSEIIDTDATRLVLDSDKKLQKNYLKALFDDANNTLFKGFVEFIGVHKSGAKLHLESGISKITWQDQTFLVLAITTLDKVKTYDPYSLERAFILEMIIDNAPMKKILESTIDMMQSHLQGIKICFWINQPSGSWYLGTDFPPEIDFIIQDKVSQFKRQFNKSKEVKFPSYMLDLENEDYGSISSMTGFKKIFIEPLLGHNINKNLSGVMILFQEIDSPSFFSDWRWITSYIKLAELAIDKSNQEERLVHLAMHDPLTGLATRGVLFNRLEHLVESCAKSSYKVAILFLGIDNFKLINDSFGNAYGDWLLVEVASRLQIALRSTDKLARFSGDEFVVICERISQEQECLVVAERISQALKRPFRIDDNEIVITSSIGLALSQGKDIQAEELIANASAAMHKAKELGKDRICLFGEKIRQTNTGRSNIISGLHRAIDRGELRTFYQPIYNLSTNSVFGLEALIRWQHPTEGLISPDKFIPYAESSGLIVSLGAWVLYNSCKQLSTWQENKNLSFSLSVNLSAVQLGNKNIVEDVKRALEESRFDPQNLHLEITESALMSDPRSSLEALTKLKELGVKLAIDDFGTGYSSLSYLQCLPVDILKIDRSFIKNLSIQSSNSAIVAAIANLADALDLQWIAEGAETLDQVEELERLGCVFVQGYYFSPPHDFKEISSLLEEQLH